MVAVAFAPLLLAPSCQDLQPVLVIEAPVHGVFTEVSEVLVSGKLYNVHPSLTVDLTINDIPVAVVNGAFSTFLQLDTSQPVQPIIAEAVLGSGKLLRDRVTIIYGDSIPEGEASPDAFALRVTNPGLKEVEPVIEDLIGLDPAIFIPPGSLVVSDFCYLEGPLFGVCYGKVSAWVAGAPAPTMTGLTASVTSNGGALDVEVEIRGLALRANVGETSGININCNADIYSDVTRIQARFDIGADAAGNIDAQQVSPVSVQMGAFSYNTDCEGLLEGLYEVFIGLIITDLKNDFVLPGIRDYLNRTVNGDTVVADALEFALDGLDIDGTVSEEIGVKLEAPIDDIVEDDLGFTVRANSKISASMPGANAVDLAASYHVDEPFPSFSPSAPNGESYQLGMGISASGFNQLLKAMIESGLLIVSVREVDLSGADDPFLANIGVVKPITAGLFGLVFGGGFKDLPPGEPVRIDVYPTMAPFVTGQPGPNGELATLAIPHLLLSFVTESDDKVVLQLVLDGTLGFNASFEDGVLNILMSEPEADDLQFTVLDNPLEADEARILGLLPAVAKSLVPTLASALGNFPLPDFLGLQLDLVDLTRNGEYMSLFFNLSTPAPAPPQYRAPSECGYLRGGEGLAAGEWLSSCNDAYGLYMQGDGNFVLYDQNFVPLWNSMSAGSPARFAVMQTDGNLVLYDALSTPYWDSSSWGNPGASLHLQDDGNLSIEATNGVVVWSAVP